MTQTRLASSVRTLSLICRCLLSTAVVVGGFGTAAATTDDDSDFNRLAELFGKYCAEHKHLPTACDGTAPRGWQWLHVNEYCTQPDAVDGVCNDFKTIREETIPPLLEYDHVAQTWRPVEKSIWLRKGKLEKDVTGAPLVFLPRKHELVVLISNTNPLLYRATIAESTEEDIEQLADLGTLVSLLGGVMGAVAADSVTIVESQQETLVTAADGLENAKKDLQDLADAVAKVGSLIQEVELATSGVKSTCDFSAPSRQKIVDTGLKLRDIRNAASQVPEDIGKAFTAYLKILDAAPKKWAAVESAKHAFAALVETSPQSKLLRELPVEGGGTTKTLQQSVSAIVDAPSLESERKLFRKDGELKKQQIEMLYVLGAKTQALLEKWPEAVKAASQIELFADRCERALVGDEIVRWMILASEDPPIKWSKRQKHSIKISVDSPFAEKIAPKRPPEVTTAYRLEWRGTRVLDVGFALTYTPLESPTFSAVTDPNDSSMKIIEETGQDSRSGEFAVLLNYQFVQHALPRTRYWTVRPSLDAGAGLDLGTPSFFAGLSVGIGKYFRIGGGWTWQQVKALDGQSVGDTVTSNDDIRTRNTFEDDYYASVMFSLGSLPFFKPK